MKLSFPFPSFYLALISILLAGGCAKLIGGDDGIATTTPEAVTRALSVKVETHWQGQPTLKTLEKSCTIPSSITPYSAVLECAVTIPEARLFHSHLLLTPVTDGTCPIVTFKPYYYRASAESVFGPEWGAPIACDSAELDKNCFNGPASYLISDFPKHSGLYFLGESEREHTYDIKSAEAMARTTNRWTSNNLPDALRGQSGNPLTGDGYVANSFQDYVFYCHDVWLEPIYTIKLIIKDDDETAGNPTPDTGTSNHYADWESIFDPR